jgi:hypothetical protein
MNEKNIITPETLENDTDLYDGMIISALSDRFYFEGLDPSVLLEVHKRLIHYANVMHFKDDASEHPFEYIEAQDLGKKLAVAGLDEEYLKTMAKKCEELLR